MAEKSQISRTIEIEDLIEHYPFALHYLAQKGIRCIICGESVWGTLEEAAREKGFDTIAIDGFVNELRMLAINDHQYFEGKVRGGFIDNLPSNPGT